MPLPIYPDIQTDTEPRRASHAGQKATSGAAALGAKRSFGDRMKSTVADSSIQVRWGSGYWVSEAGVIPQPSSDTIGPATDTTGVAGAIGKAGTSVSPGN